MLDGMRKRVARGTIDACQTGRRGGGETFRSVDSILERVSTAQRELRMPGGLRINNTVQSPIISSIRAVHRVGWKCDSHVVTE